MTRRNARGAAARKTSSRRRKTSAAKPTRTSAEETSPTKRWSQRVTQDSDALDLQEGVFTLKDPTLIAASLKRSAERSTRRKTSAFRSAMAMLTFYVNRAGRALPETQRARLEQAKDELRRQFGR